MDSRGPAPWVVGAFRPSVFPDTILPGSFCPLERRAHLGRGAKSFLRLFRHAASGFSAAPDGRRVVRRDGSSRPSLRGKSRPERSLIPVAEGAFRAGATSHFRSSRRANGDRRETGNRMSDDHVLKSAKTIVSIEDPTAAASQDSSNWKSSVSSHSSHKVFQLAWYAVNAFLVVAIFATLYSAVWEYSTRRYLKGFSDAIVPATAPGDEKVEAILSWMAP